MKSVGRVTATAAATRSATRTTTSSTKDRGRSTFTGLTAHFLRLVIASKLSANPTKGSMEVLATVDWTNVLDTAIFTIPAVIAALYARSVHVQVRTPSGKSLGEVAEYSHDTAIANNLLLRHKNGPTKPATPEQLHEEGSSPPSVPDDSGATRP